MLRPGTDERISLIGMDAIPDCVSPDCNQWTAASYSLTCEREVVAITGDMLRIDQPLVHGLDVSFGGGEVYKINMARLEEIGIENMRLESTYSSSVGIDTDEDHAWTAVQFNNVQHSWARSLECWHFTFSCVHTMKDSKYISTLNCTSYDPASIITGGRRYSFDTDGQRNLVSGCHSRNGRHDYVTGSKVPGPNVFHDSSAVMAHSDIGPHHRYATGILWDTLRGFDARVWDRGNMGSGVRQSEERSDELTTQSQAAKTARAHTSVQDAPSLKPPRKCSLIIPTLFAIRFAHHSMGGLALLM